jgi:D-aspartate ligase
MTAQSVLVTNGNDQTGVHAAAELAAAGYDVRATDFGRLPLGLRSRFVGEFYPVSGRSQQEFETNFLDLIRRVCPAVLLPLGSRFVYTSILHRQWIEETTALNVPSLEAFCAAFDKRQCMAECASLGIPHPRNYTLADAQGLLMEGRDDVRLVVKPDRDIGAANGVSYVTQADELLSDYNRCVAKFGGALIQDYIPGGSDAMKAVTFLFDPDSRLIAAFTLQKIRQWPNQGGSTVLARSTADEALVQQMLPFFQRWKWQGSAEVELKFDQRDGLHKVIEINPRFPGYLRFTGQCGLQLSALAATLALGKQHSALPFPNYRHPLTYFNPGGLLESVLTDWPRAASKRQFLRQLGSDLTHAHPPLAGTLSDPLPMVGRVLNRVIGAKIGARFYPALAKREAETRVPELIGTI